MRAQEVQLPEGQRDAEASVKRALSQRRAAEFIGLALGHHAPTVPLYERRVRVGAYNALSKDRDETVGYDHKADGWLVRPRRYVYEDGIIPGLLLAEDGTVYECGQLGNVPPSEASLSAAADMRARTFVVASQVRTTEDRYVGSVAPEVESGIVFADDDGLSMLAEALIRQGISA